MGIFSKIKKKKLDAINSKIDPAKELDLIIDELEEQRRGALKELISYKATAKQLEEEIEKYKTEAETWEKRAMVAVKEGDDELAKKCLTRKAESLVQVKKITADRNEAASYALELNQSRKKAETKLRILKLKKGTMATQIKAAKTGNILGVDDSLFDKLDQAEDAIDSELAASEADSEMSLEASDAEFDAKLLAASGTASAASGGAGGDTESALQALKKQVEKERAKRLPAGDPEGE